MGWGHLLMLDAGEPRPAGWVDGRFACSWSWIKRVSEKMNLVSRAPTTTAQKLPADYNIQRDRFKAQLAYMIYKLKCVMQLRASVQYGSLVCVCVTCVMCL